MLSFTTQPLAEQIAYVLLLGILAERTSVTFVLPPPKNALNQDIVLLHNAKINVELLAPSNYSPFGLKQYDLIRLGHEEEGWK